MLNMSSPTFEKTNGKTLIRFTSDKQFLKKVQSFELFHLITHLQGITAPLWPARGQPCQLNDVVLRFGSLTGHYAQIHSCLVLS